MKKLMVLFAILFTTPIFAQITLEHTYEVVDTMTSVVSVSDSEQFFVGHHRHDKVGMNDQLSIYNLDHSIYKRLYLPSAVSYVGYFSRTLFNNDKNIEFVCQYNLGSGVSSIRIIDENTNIIFSCDTCHLSFNLQSYGVNRESIYSTNAGTKMILVNDKDHSTEVYSLPGKLPTSNTQLSVTDAPTIISSSSPSTSAYPNPSNGKIRVAYTLPEGVTTGELVITTTDGREVKRYRVGNMFNDILIEKSELASGAYFYRLVTERGQSEARKFVITN